MLKHGFAVVSFEEYYLEDVIQMLGFVPPLQEKKKKREEGEDDEEVLRARGWVGKAEGNQPRVGVIK